MRSWWSTKRSAFVPGDYVKSKGRGGDPRERLDWWLWTAHPDEAIDYFSICPFSFGLVLANRKDYIFVIDSITCKLGWINHSHVAKVWS